MAADLLLSDSNQRQRYLGIRRVLAVINGVDARRKHDRDAVAERFYAWFR
jgi:hypothetical protein